MTPETLTDEEIDTTLTASDVPAPAGDDGDATDGDTGGGADDGDGDGDGGGDDDGGADA